MVAGDEQSGVRELLNQLRPLVVLLVEGLILFQFQTLASLLFAALCSQGQVGRRGLLPLDAGADVFANGPTRHDALARVIAALAVASLP